MGERERDGWWSDNRRWSFSTLVFQGPSGQRTDLLAGRERRQEE